MANLIIIQVKSPIRYYSLCYFGCLSTRGHSYVGSDILFAFYIKYEKYKHFLIVSLETVEPRPK